jgi:hypothetical protein
VKAGAGLLKHHSLERKNAREDWCDAYEISPHDST